MSIPAAVRFDPTAPRSRRRGSWWGWRSESDPLWSALPWHEGGTGDWLATIVPCWRRVGTTGWRSWIRGLRWPGRSAAWSRLRRRTMELRNSMSCWRRSSTSWIAVVGWLSRLLVWHYLGAGLRLQLSSWGQWIFGPDWRRGRPSLRVSSGRSCARYLVIGPRGRPRSSGDTGIGLRAASSDDSTSN